MAILKDTTVNGDLIVNGNIESHTIDELKNMINVQAAKLNSTWINLEEKSIFDYFPYNDKTGIYSCFNGTDLPSTMTKDSWFVVLKSHEKMFIFGDTGIYGTNSHGGTWTRDWYTYTSNVHYSDTIAATVINAEALFCKTGNVKSFTIGGAVNQVLVANHQYGLFVLPDGFKPSMIVTEHHITSTGKVINVSFTEDGTVYITPFSQVEVNDLIRLHITYI